LDQTHEAGRPRVQGGLILLFSAIAGFLVFFGGAFAMGITFGGWKASGSSGKNSGDHYYLILYLHEQIHTLVK
jgi:hypothetical protein